MRIAALAFTSALAAGCAASEPPPAWYAPQQPAGYGVAPPPPAAPSSAPYEVGRASMYSDKLAGRPTASREPYDPHALTAAHRTLPFGTIVEVTRRDGRRVLVRINDRGPFVKGRVIDVSRRAAVELGMVREGVVDVALRVVSINAGGGA